MHDMHFGSNIKKLQIEGYMGYGDRFLFHSCFKFFGILYLKPKHIFKFYFSFKKEKKNYLELHKTFLKLDEKS